MHARPCSTELSALPERTKSAGQRSKSTRSTQLKWEARSMRPPAHPEFTLTELKYPRRSWISMVHKSLKIREEKNQTGNPRCQKGQKKMKGVRETTSRRAQRGQGHLHHHSQSTQTPSAYKPEPAAWPPLRARWRSWHSQGAGGGGPPHGTGGLA